MAALKRYLVPVVIVVELAAIGGLIYLIRAALYPRPNADMRELEQNLAKWQNHHITHYRMALTIGCFCEPYFDGTMPVEVEVRNEQVVSAVDAKGRPYTPGTVMTIMDMFRYASGAMQDPTESASVRYDPTYGYPIGVGVSPATPIPDAWTSFEVADFEILPA